MRPFFLEFHDSLRIPIGSICPKFGMKLEDRFVVPPISVLDVRQAYWKARKRFWLDRLHDSSRGRGKNLLKVSKTMAKKHLQTSVFDPVLTEISYLWFSKSGDKVYDPFSGGSIRGEIAAHLGRRYLGVDVREEQVMENRSIRSVEPRPKWIVGDSSKYVPPAGYDFVFTCPPYLWLERYSDQPDDLSTLSEEEFLKRYYRCISNAVSGLRDHRFAVFVVGNVRRSDGTYCDLVSHTKRAFAKAGLFFYNDLVLLQEPASAAMRAEKYMLSSRKVAKTHQNVLVFLKGNSKKATVRLGDIGRPFQVKQASLFG